MPKTVPTSKKRSITPVSTDVEKLKTMDSVSENQPHEITQREWETLIDISEESSSISLREFIINHIGFKAYISYKLKQRKAIWAMDMDMLTSALEDLENIQELESQNDQKLSFLTNLLDEAQLEQYIKWLNQNNL